MGKPVVFFDIGCRDNEATRSFYEKIFGWTALGDSPHSSRMETGADTGIDGAVTSLGHEPHNYVMIYVEVKDINATLEEIEENGGETLVPATQIPEGGEFAWFRDPEGNMIGLLQGYSEDED